MYLSAAAASRLRGQLRTYQRARAPEPQPENQAAFVATRPFDRAEIGSLPISALAIALALTSEATRSDAELPDRKGRQNGAPFLATPGAATGDPAHALESK